MLALTYDIRAWRWLSCKLLGLLTPGVYLSGLSGLRLRQVPKPELPGPQWVRLRTILGGICGTDLGLIYQRSHPASTLRNFTSFPVVLGHENVAVIEDVGPKVTGWHPGQRVCVEPSLSCSVRGIEPPCSPCAAGRFALCDNFISDGLPAGTMLGLNSFTGGSWAPAFVAHETQLHAVPESVSDEQAVLVDPIACALHGLLRHQPGPGDRVLVQGAGIIGVALVACLRARGCAAPVTALVRHQCQAELMQTQGATDTLVIPRQTREADKYDRVASAIDGRRVPGGFGNQALIGGYDVVYDCIGSGRSLTDAMKFTRPRGTTVALGTSGISIVDTTPLWFNELNVVGVYGRQIEIPADAAPRHTYGLVFDLLTSGKLDPAGWLTHTFGLQDYKQALRTLLARQQTGALKVAFRHDEDC